MAARARIVSPTSKTSNPSAKIPPSHHF
jgi:hypothetical protein